jgi:hypothetical protein
LLPPESNRLLRAIPVGCFAQRHMIAAIDIAAIIESDIRNIFKGVFII